MSTSKTEERLFSSIDGEDVRVCHPDGTIAIVGVKPRTLPPKLWRNAIKAGCQSSTGFKAEDLPNIPVKDDAFTRKNAIKKAINDALDADDGDPKYADAFTANDIPKVTWLEKVVGFSLTSDERDVAFNEVVAERDEDEDEDENEGEDE